MKERCSIIGFGRFGQLLAKILSQDFSVVAFDVQENRDQAEQLGIEFVSFDQACRQPTVFFCVPISKFAGAIRESIPHLNPGTLVMDTCSVKVHPVQVMRRELPGTVQALATHPLFGPDSAKNGLAGLRIVFSPVRISQEQLDFWREFWQRQGVMVIEKTAHEHDRLAAYSQGITHFLGRVLGELDLRSAEITTKGFEDILGVIEQTNNDTWQLFFDLQRYNPYTKEMRDRLVQAFNTILAKLDPP